MPGYQFIHIETYSRVPSKNNKKQSILGIVKEAERHSTASLHIANPQPPLSLYGDTPLKMAKKLINTSEKCVDAMGRKLRKDAQILLAGVASYPIPTDSLEFDDDNFNEWLRLTLSFLKSEYGNNLKSVIGHFGDEPYNHVHFYCHPSPSIKNTINIRDVHIGMKQRDTVPDKGEGSGKKRRKLYKDAMRQFQDRYYEKVAKLCGQSRIGPKRNRLTRKEWRDEQLSSEKQAEALKNINKYVLAKNDAIKAKKNNALILQTLKKEEMIAEQKLMNKIAVENDNSFFKSKKIQHLMQVLKDKNKEKSKISKKLKTMSNERNILEKKLEEKSMATTSYQKENQFLMKKISSLLNTLDKYKKSITSLNLNYSKLVNFIKSGNSIPSSFLNTKVGGTYER